MENSTWFGRVAERIRAACRGIDDRVFREPDIDAIARGWEVRRDRRFHRTYRDPRWDSIIACPACGGSGACGARVCATCDGRGTVRTGAGTPTPADATPARATPAGATPADPAPLTGSAR